jgi:serine/threonine protein kinase
MVISSPPSQPVASPAAVNVMGSTFSNPIDGASVDVKSYVSKGGFGFIVYPMNIVSGPERTQAIELVNQLRRRDALYDCACFFVAGVSTRAKVSLFQVGTDVPGDMITIPSLPEVRRMMVPTIPGVETAAIWTTKQVEEALKDSAASAAQRYGRIAVVLVFYYDNSNFTRIASSLKKVLTKLPYDSTKLRPPLVVFVDVHNFADRVEHMYFNPWLSALPSIQLLRCGNGVDLEVTGMGPIDNFPDGRIMDLLMDAVRDTIPVTNGRVEPVPSTQFPLAIRQALPLLTIDRLNLTLPDETQEPLGAGSFGKVVRGNYLGLEVAVKLVSMTTPADAAASKTPVALDYESEAFQEAYSMASLRHPYITTLVGATLRAEVPKTPPTPQRPTPAVAVYQVALVQELMSHSMMSWVRMLRTDSLSSEAAGVTKRQRYEALRQLAVGLTFMHHSGRIHGDMKPANSLYDKGSRTAKLADLGHAKLFTAMNTMKRSTTPGTPDYMAPEILHIMHPGAGLPPTYTETAGIDVFAFGLMIAEIGSSYKVWGDLYAADNNTDAVMLALADKRRLDRAARITAANAADAKRILDLNEEEAKRFSAIYVGLRRGDPPRLLHAGEKYKRQPVQSPHIAYMYANALSASVYEEGIEKVLHILARLSAGIQKIVKQCLLYDPGLRPASVDIIHALDEELANMKDGDLVYT